MYYVSVGDEIFFYKGLRWGLSLLKIRPILILSEIFTSFIKCLFNVCMMTNQKKIKNCLEFCNDLGMGLRGYGRNRRNGNF